MEIDWTWRAPALGPAKSVTLPAGRIRYHERGEGPVIVFVHGWLANANLWRKVVPLLADRYRCVVPDLPFGAHLEPMSDALDGTPDGIARLINDFLDALGVDDVTLVGNDSGGAYSQIATAANPRRVRCLILNACETPYDTFPPAAFDGLQQAAGTPATLVALLGALRDRTVRHGPAAFGLLIKHSIEDAASDSYALPALELEGVCRDATRVMPPASQTYVAAAGDLLIDDFTGTVTFIWPTEDVFFSLDNVRRYAAELRHGRVELVEDAFAFTPEDQPNRFAELVSRAIVGSEPTRVPSLDANAPSPNVPPR
jgi:pimeloyl-ACP methyl ester carboxylesterase